MARARDGRARLRLGGARAARGGRGRAVAGSPASVQRFLAAGSVAEPRGARARRRGAAARPPSRSAPTGGRAHRALLVAAGGDSAPRAGSAAARSGARAARGLASPAASRPTCRWRCCSRAASTRRRWRCVAGRAASARRAPSTCALGDERRAARGASSPRRSASITTRSRVDGARGAALERSALAAQDQPSVDGANTYLIARAIHDAGLQGGAHRRSAPTSCSSAIRCIAATLRARRLQRALDGAAAPLALAPRLAASLARRPAPGACGASRSCSGVAARRATPPATYAARARCSPPRRSPAAPAGRRRPTRRTTPAIADARSRRGEVSRLELSRYLVNTLLRDADVMGMAHGVELRVPMLDRRLVEAVLAAGRRALKLPRRARRSRSWSTRCRSSPPRSRRPQGGLRAAARARGCAGPLRRPVEEALRDAEAARRVGARRARGGATCGRASSSSPDRPVGAPRLGALRAARAGRRSATARSA